MLCLLTQFSRRFCLTQGLLTRITPCLILKKIDQIVWTVAQCFIIPPSLSGQRFVPERGRASYASISWFTLLPTSPSSPPYVGNRFIENRQFVGLVFCFENCCVILHSDAFWQILVHWGLDKPLLKIHGVLIKQKM